MKPEKKVDDIVEIKTGVETLDNNPNYLNKLLSFKGKDIMASDISKYGLMPLSQTQNKYPSKVMQIMVTLMSGQLTQETVAFG